jgi:hypothetical protein
MNAMEINEALLTTDRNEALLTTLTTDRDALTSDL